MKDILKTLTERERDLLDYCISYGSGKASGLPGHTLMIIIFKLWKALTALTKVEKTKEETKTDE